MGASRRHRPQSSSSSRRTASQVGFLLLSQSGERPERYVEVLHFDTMPSRPILQAWANTVGPSASMSQLLAHPASGTMTIMTCSTEGVGAPFFDFSNCKEDSPSEGQHHLPPSNEYETSCYPFATKLDSRV